MTNKRVYVSSRSAPPDPPLVVKGSKQRSQYAFGRLQRWTVSVIALVLHTCSFVYLFCFAVVYFTVPDDQINILSLFAPRVTSLLILLVAMLNLRGIVSISFPRCNNSAIVTYDPSITPTTLAGRAHQYYIRCFSRYGLFGLHGDLYDVRAAFKHLTQIATQAHEAHRMSLYLTHPGVTVLNTAILATGCFVVPLMLFSRDPFVHRWGSSFADAILNFVLCAGFPLVLLFRAISDFYFSGSDTLLWNREWLIEMIMLARAVCIKSFVDLISLLFLFISSFISLKNLHAAVHVKLGDIASSREASASLAALAVGRLEPHKSFLLRTCRVGLLVLSTGMSVFLVTAATTTSRDTCPVGCVLQTYPWFSPSCHCVLMRQNCVLNPVPNNDIDAFIRARLPHVFDLEVIQCDLPRGLSKATLQSLYNLYSLTLRLTNTVAWDVSPLDFPPSMYVLYLVDQSMPRLPNAVAANAHNLRYLLLRNVSLTRDNSVPHYVDLYQLALSNASLAAVPAFVFGMTTLTNVEFDHNKLAELPVEFSSHPTLQTISLMFNAITTVPISFLQQVPPTLKTLYLEGNPIEALPLDMDVQLLVSQRVRIQGTPLCTRLQNVPTSARGALPPLEQEIANNWDTICAVNCAVGCHTQFVTDTVCESVCLTPACHFDTIKSDYDAGGIAASECFGVVTGWEHLATSRAGVES